MHSEMSIGGRVDNAHFFYSINEQGKAWVSGRIRYADNRPFPSSTEEYILFVDSCEHTGNHTINKPHGRSLIGLSFPRFVGATNHASNSGVRYSTKLGSAHVATSSTEHAHALLMMHDYAINENQRRRARSPCIKTTSHTTTTTLQPCSLRSLVA